MHDLGQRILLPQNMVFWDAAVFPRTREEVFMRDLRAGGYGEKSLVHSAKCWTHTSIALSTEKARRAQHVRGAL